MPVYSLPQSLASFEGIPPIPTSGVPSIPGYVPYTMPLLTGNEWWMEQQRRARMDEQFWKEIRLAELRNRLTYEEAAYTTPGGFPSVYTTGPSTGRQPVPPTQIYGTQGPPSAPIPTPGSNPLTDIHRPYRPAALLTQSKFTPRIAQAEITRKLKKPTTVGKYDGTTDPDDHINIFISVGGIAGAGEDLMIAVFIQVIQHDELIRRLHGRDGLPKTMDELMIVALSTWIRPLPYTRPEPTRFVNPLVRFKDNPENRGTAWVNKLVKSPREVLLTEKLTLDPPRPLNPKSIRDPKRYCEFHKDTRHDTDHCWHLQKQIDIAIQTGKLSHLLKEIHAGPPGWKPTGKKPVRDLCMIGNNEFSNQRGHKCGGARLEAWMEQPLIFPPVRGGASSTSPMVIMALVGDYRISRIVVDIGASMDVMYEQLFRRLDVEDQKTLEPTNLDLVGFSGESVVPLRQLTLPMTLREGAKICTVLFTFMVIPTVSKNNMILGRPGLASFHAAVSTVHSAISFPTPKGIDVVYADQVAEVLQAQIAQTSSNNHPDIRMENMQGPEKWVMNPAFPEQIITIGHTLSTQGRDRLKQFLRNNLDIFAWKLEDMKGVSRELAEHRLHVHKSADPIVQKCRKMGSDRSRAVVDQVRDLVNACILREVHYPTWLANPVMVKKGNGAWRMCIDYKNINNACPKDAYPLPEIDFKIDSLAPFRFKCFMDAYKSYHQIPVAENDEEKTAFITDIGVFSYTEMPFGLKKMSEPLTKDS
ncbi:hypothetical protein L1987_37507 [Smallanthus sonchifolius]|uniref:Uncharacterized protein n=1 Tax=Smallanthus sonchifolius TaxID=185202 RepID=A0ACB9HGZ6_9ASTR|nr:hypothetical protein L1987_37507 [Smallanthus sonchifolius]